MATGTQIGRLRQDFELAWNAATGMADPPTDAELATLLALARELDRTARVRAGRMHRPNRPRVRGRGPRRCVGRSRHVEQGGIRAVDAPHAMRRQFPEVVRYSEPPGWQVTPCRRDPRRAEYRRPPWREHRRERLSALAASVESLEPADQLPDIGVISPRRVPPNHGCPLIGGNAVSTDCLEHRQILKQSRGDQRRHSLHNRVSQGIVWPQRRCWPDCRRDGYLGQERLVHWVEKGCRD